jgi:hypothetical protein
MTPVHLLLLVVVLTCLLLLLLLGVLVLLLLGRCRLRCQLGCPAQHSTLACWAGLLQHL